jgi:type IV secretory pathway protease TraF
MLDKPLGIFFVATFTMSNGHILTNTSQSGPVGNYKSSRCYLNKSPSNPRKVTARCR